MKILNKWFYFLLLWNAFSVEARSINQDSDIFWDIHYGDSRAIARWLRSDQNVNQLNTEGQSVLIKSVIKENKLLVQKLLANRAINVNVVDSFGCTALDYAVQQENKALVRMLLKKKALVTTDFNAIKCRELTVKRSGWRILGTVLLGVVGVGLLCTSWVLGGVALGLIAGASVTQSAAPVYVFLGVMTVLGTGVLYGGVKVSQTSKDSDVYVSRMRA